MNKQQLANKIWESANKMRSKIEANEYKDYILGFIFYKFLCERQTKILKEQGYILNYEEILISKKFYLLLSLKYYNQRRQPIITGLKRISKPGLRIYVRKNNLPVVINNLGIAILSTSQGIITNTKAKKLGIGGEVLCYIW